MKQQFRDLLYAYLKISHACMCYSIEPLAAVVCYIAITDASAPAANFLAIGVFILLSWVIHLRLPLHRWQGWYIRPWTGYSFFHPRSLYVDRGCLEEVAVLAGVAAPDTFRNRLTLRADSSSLLLATAAALTNDQLPDAFRDPLHAALAEVGMQPARTAKRWTVLDHTQIHGADAVIVQDGTGARFFLTAPPEMLLPAATHIWTESEQPLDPAGAAWLLDAIAQHIGALAPQMQDSFTAGYFTGEWTDDGPASLTYLGAMIFAYESSAAMREAIQRTALPLVSEPDSRTLCIVPEPIPGLQPQMICESAVPSSFADARYALREHYTRRLRCAVFFPVMVYLLAYSCAPLACMPEAPAIVAAALLLPMVDARLRQWHFHLPRLRWLGGLSLLATMFAGMMLGGLAAYYTQAAGAFIAFCGMAGWGFALSLLLRQKPVRWSFAAITAAAWCMLFYYAVMTANVVAALFGTVLTALCLLPVLTARNAVQC